jgi:cytochrome P450
MTETRRMLSGAKPGSGHFEEFLAHPALLMLRAFQHVFAYIPFGGGRRKCVGNAFALLQVKVIFCGARVIPRRPLRDR